jgi:thiamine-phosphate pyrophosphorylase
LHTHHTLVKDFALKGIHFREEDRIQYIDDPSNYFMGLPMYGKTISSSFHSVESLEKCSFEFDYHFLSPVFSSISKKGYLGKEFTVHSSSKTIIGLGGGNRENFKEFETLGYSGVAFLGGIWESETPREDFEIILAHFLKNYNF